ncbi:hypothetical protein BG003_011515 [Podila horticola]|nr:hypothetical protein BG003_011515 [Podila horticola]
MTYAHLQEEYALNPAARPEFLKNLTPGTEEHYLFHLLYKLQKLQDPSIPITVKAIDEASTLLKAAQDSGVVYDYSVLDQISVQLAILSFGVKPEILLKELNFDQETLANASASAPTSVEDDFEDLGLTDASEALPSGLDQALVKTEVLTQKLIDALKDSSYASVPSQIWPHLLAQPAMEKVLLEQWTPSELNNTFRSLSTVISAQSLEILGKADSTRVDQLIVKMIVRLHAANLLNFGEYIQHLKNLTVDQLQQIKKLVPAAANDEGFVGLLEKRIVPESFAVSEDAAHQAWLDRMVQFVDGLSPKFNLQKLSVYLMSLEQDLSKGFWDRKKFLRYVAIPRNHSHYSSKALSKFEADVVVNLYYSSTLRNWSTRVTPADSTRDNEIVEEYLTHFMRESKSYAEYEPYFDVKDFLAPLLARTMLTAGDKDVEKWSRLLASHENLAALSKKTIIRFAPDNPSKFLPSDSVVFNLRAKNAKRILVRVFEIKTFEYLQQHGQGDGVEGLGMNLNLDGLTPNWEHHLTLDKPSIEMHDVTIELTELANRRGAFVLDVISNGENSSAYFTKGCLDFVERQSVAGHIITVVDEQQRKLVDKTSVWLNGYYYKPNGDGDVIIPYRKASTSASGKVYLIHDGFATRRSFTHRVESYGMKMSCHIDNEAMVSGCTAKAVLRPIVQIQGITSVVPVSLLEQVVLNIQSVDTNNITATSTVPDFKVHDVDWSEYNFQVPENLSSISFTLSAKIKVISTGELQDLSVSEKFEFSSPVTDASTSFEVNGQWHSVKCQGEVIALLQKGSDGYKILVVGKNGEKRAHTTLHIQLGHPCSPSPINAYLRSDSAGYIYLGPLKDVTFVACTSTRQSWELIGRNKAQYPSVIHGIAGESIALPFYRHEIEYIRGVSLYSMSIDPQLKYADTCAVKDYTNHASLRDGVLTINKLDAGYYTLQLDAHTKIDLSIANAKATRSSILGLEDYLIRSNPMMEVVESTRRPLYMSAPKSNNESRSLEVQLYNWSTETRLCLIASKFTPARTAFPNLAVLEAEDPWHMKKTELTSTSFKAGRVLGDEYQYVLNRKTQSAHWAGNLLTKPSVLLTPWAVSNSTTVTKPVMAEENLVECRTKSTARKCTGSGAPRSGMYMSYSGGVDASNDKTPLLTFLVNPSVILVNLTPDQQTGLVKIPVSALKESTYLEIFAVDGSQSVQQTISIAGGGHVEFQKRDLRFKTQIDHRKHYIAEKTGIKLDPTISSHGAASTSHDVPSTEPASITLNSTGSSSSSVRVISSVSQIYDLMLTLLASETHKQDLRKFGFIVDWPRLSSEAKKDKYSKWNCHEMNLFLYKKDKEFFDAVVAPFLKNKLIKSFMDEYLIEAPLDHYTALKDFSELSCMEKCLLAQRVPSLRPAVIQWVKDRVPDVRSGTNAKLFNTVMNSGALKEVDEDADMYSPTSPAYSPTSPDFGTMKKSKKKRTVHLDVEADVSEDDEEEAKEESDDDMGFGLFDGGSAPGGAYDMLTSAPSPPAPIAAMAPMSMMKRAAPIAAGALRLEAERAVKRQFKPLDLTKEMGETYYYNRRDIAPSDKKEANLFWLDFIHWVQSLSGSFLSQNFVVNTGSFTDAMATLALVEVAFKPKDISLSRSADQNLVITSHSPSIVFHSSTKELSEVPVTGTVLVTQQYYAQDEKTVYDEKLKAEVRRYIQPTAEFRPLESYGAHVVLMNASSNPLKVHLELQIPHGSISIYGSLDSSQDIHLSPHGSFQYEYGFYFPEQGDFPHYPAHVSSYEDIIAFAPPAALHVRDPEPNRHETDTTSWTYVLKSGTKEDILHKLATGSMTGHFPEALLMPRLNKDARFLQQVTSTLRSRQEYRDGIWRQSLVIAQSDVSLVREYLEHQAYLVSRLPDWFTSKYIVRRPHSRLTDDYDSSIQYLEYFPLVNSRAHKANREATVSNDQFKKQYTRFLDLLSRKPRHEVDDLLVLIVYLLAQDRIQEAKTKFSELSTLMNSSAAANKSQHLQYDYLRAYLSLCVEVHGNVGASTIGGSLSLDLVGVLQILAKYKNYPVERWNRMFKDMQAYVDEIIQSNEATTATFSTTPAASSSTATAADSATTLSDSASMDVDEDEDELSGLDVPVMVDFKIGDDSVVAVRHRGVREVTVEYYSIEAETMFSSAPLTFSDQGENEQNNSGSSSSSSDSSTNSYRLVKPNGIDTHVVKRAVANDGILMIPILPQYLNTNVMVSVSTSPPAATKSWKAYYSQTILVQALEQTGTIKVISKTDGRPIRGGYVKVYAEMKEGYKNTSFWKDGYTDLVGRFAYAQVSAGAENGGGLADVKRFVVFVDGGKEGCVVKVVPVPPV